LGAVAFASFIPILLLSPFAGVLIDRVDRYKLVTFTQAASIVPAVILTVLTLSGLVTFWQVMVLATLQGIIKAVEMPARQTFIVDLVGPKHLMNGIALHSIAFNSARVIGPTVAGLIIAASGEGLAFAINTLSFMAVVFALLMMDRPSPAPRPKEQARPLEDLKAGFRYVGRDSIIFSLVAMVAIQGFLILPYLNLLPLFAGDILNAGPEGLGALLSAVGFGALLGGMTLAGLGNFRRKGILALLATISFSLGLSVFALSGKLGLSLALLVVVGWSQIATLALNNTLIQAQVEDRFRGRVNSVRAWMLGGMLPIGSLLMGALAESLGIARVIFVASLLGGLLIVGLFLREPRLRRLS
ncbi:MAG TPA: MFS transporter, partial [Anaerolineales bacterium]